MSKIRIFVNDFRGPITTDSLTYEEAEARLTNPNDVLDVTTDEDGPSRRYAIPVRSVRAISAEADR